MLALVLIRKVQLDAVKGGKKSAAKEMLALDVA